MGVLWNREHENFCQAVVTHMMAGKSRGEARTLAYREAVAVDGCAGEYDADNARRLSNKLKARIEEILERATIIAEIDRAWSLCGIKNIADGPRESDKYGTIKPNDRLAAYKLINDMNGYNAPVKVANTDSAGNDLPPMTDADRARVLEAFIAKTKATTPKENENGR